MMDIPQNDSKVQVYDIGHIRRKEAALHNIGKLVEAYQIISKQLMYRSATPEIRSCYDKLDEAFATAFVEEAKRLSR